MALHNINPTETKAWKKLKNHYKEIKEVHLRHLFNEDLERNENFNIKLNDLQVNFSKNRITNKTVNLLVELAEECQLKEAIDKYFLGDKINVTENRAVLHTALRDSSDDPIFVDGKDIKPSIKTVQRKIRAFSNKVISGKWKGYTGKPITDVVNIGVGGSELGSAFVVEALRYYKNHLKTHFVSNVDGDNVSEVLKELNPETTLFIIVSKSFTTQETMTNANTIRDWFLNTASVFDIAKHFVAVSTNIQEVQKFGIDKKNIFTMWSWVGGRFSVWSSVGLIISLAVGYDNYTKLLEGAEEIDIHFKNTPFKENIPLLSALIGVWYTNFFKSETESVISYTQYLRRFVPFLQQSLMESNGKSVDRNGNPINYQTGAVIFGGVGTNVQHAFMQLLHQGTKLIPVDFIGFQKPLYGLEDHHKKLMANYKAQMDALAFGRTKEEAHLELKANANSEEEIRNILPFKIFEGNKPSTSILFEQLTPASLGKLIAIYEHKIFVQGVIWNIYSYDQFGVELGKELAQKRLRENKLT